MLRNIQGEVREFVSYKNVCLTNKELEQSKGNYENISVKNE